MGSAELTLIGVPANSSGTVDGVAAAPTVLRQRGLATALARVRGLADTGDPALPVPVPVRGPSGLLAGSRRPAASSTASPDLSGSW